MKKIKSGSFLGLASLTAHKGFGWRVGHRRVLFSKTQPNRVGLPNRPTATASARVTSLLTTYWAACSTGTRARFTPRLGGEVRIKNNGSADTVVSGDSGFQPGATLSSTPFMNTVGQASNGDFHGHIRYKLEPNPSPAPPLGAYGLSLSLTTSAAGVADSEEFFLVFNFGLDEAASWRRGQRLCGNPERRIPGDFNADGVVDAADYTVWRDGITREAYKEGQLLRWRENYGRTSGIEAASVHGRPYFALAQRRPPMPAARCRVGRFLPLRNGRSPPVISS